jgi:hypothetical protein
MVARAVIASGNLRGFVVWPGAQVLRLASGMRQMGLRLDTPEDVAAATDYLQRANPLLFTAKEKKSQARRSGRCGVLCVCGPVVQGLRGQASRAHEDDDEGLRERISFVCGSCVRVRVCLQPGRSTTRWRTL